MSFLNSELFRWVSCISYTLVCLECDVMLVVWCLCVCRKFNKTIEILQEDIETLENEKVAAERKLDQEAQKAIRAETPSTRRLRGASFGNPLGLREGRGGGEGAVGAQQPVGAQQASADPAAAATASPLVLARVCATHSVGRVGVYRVYA